MEKEKISIYVNNSKYELLVDTNDTLVDVLRDQLMLVGTKKSCEKGECGACSVILDGKLVLACLKLAVSTDGCHIQTVEGLGNLQNLHPLQEAFVAEGAVQCGYCTPGMLMAGKALLDQNPEPTEDEARRAISGNLCRCTGYHRIVNAILKAAEIKKGKEAD